MDTTGKTPTLSELLLSKFGDKELVVGNRFYKGQSIELDGYVFRSCFFLNCQLSTNNGTFIMERCYIVGCNLIYGPNATRIVRLFNVYNKGGWVTLNPQIDADGSITIP